MHLSSAVLGSSIVKQLESTGGAAILTVGSDKLTRADLAAVGCYNFVAARHLARALGELPAREQPRSLKDLFERIAPTDLALPGVGAISLAVLGAAFEARKVGGDTPLESYVRHHLPAKNGGGIAAHLVTFHTIKARELAEQRAERKERRRRKAQRRNKAHEMRVERFGARQQSTTAHDARRPHVR